MTDPDDDVRVDLGRISPTLFPGAPWRGGPPRERWLDRRRRRIREEIARNRRGEAAVPTWLLAVLLVVVLGGWILFVLLV